MMNDILTSIFIYLILQHIDFLLGKLLRTTIDLEDQVQEKERSRKETDDLLAAARRLLSVTCDCCEQLTDRLEMVEPSQNTLAMLQIKNPEEDARNAMSLPFLQFICTEDQDRFSQFIAASDSQAPSSLHLRMQTCKGAPFEAQVFHVNVPQSTLGCSHWHLIGISKSAAAEMTSIPEHCTVDPSPFIPLLSAPRPRSRRSVSSGSRSAAASTSSGASSEWSSSAAAAQLDRSIKEIQLISLAVEPVDFGVSSVNIVFHDAKTMNIMNWISTKSASAVQGFIQHHLNSWHHAERSTDICKRVKFRAPGTRSAFVAQMSMGEIEGEPGEGDPRKMSQRFCATCPVGAWQTVIWLRVMGNEKGGAMMLWHLQQQLFANELGDPLQISVMMKESQVKTLAGKHEVLVVANVLASKVEAFRAAVQQLIWRREVPNEVFVVPESFASSKKAIRKQRQARQRARVLFVAMTQDAPDSAVPLGQVAVFVTGKLQPSKDLKKDWDDGSNMGTIKEVALAVVNSLSPEGRVR
ncbi:unnamed protein product [Durusdinium trenchii]|uniref:Uncharacterized protein n=1 Tax=Durusdinium trenchii TaxID=1381693 RepID=A0ABP0P358_9DINO